MTLDKISPNIPAHIAIIMDGNGRWAKAQGKSRSEGHKVGKETLKLIVGECLKYNIAHLSVFAFSSENWSRPKTEVSSLMSLFLTALSDETKQLAKSGVSLKIIGERERFSLPLRSMIEMSEKTTAKNNKLILNVAVNYGGRWDIVNTTQKLAKNKIEVNENNISQNLAFAGSPEVDLLIRTGGEKRISNFMLWQIAYSEIYFSDALWPDFRENEFAQALEWFATRQRRFGKTSEQIINK